MSFVIVPNSLRDAIYEKVDAEIAKAPDAAPGREHFYSVLLDYFNEHGEIPAFSLEKRTHD